MRIHFAIVLLLGGSAILLAGCMEKIGETMLLMRGPERMDVLSERIRKEPLSKRYGYLSTSGNYEIALAAVWSFWNDTPINNTKAVEMLMKNLERWRNPTTPEMRKTMKKANGYGNFDSLQSDTITALRYIYEFTGSQKVKELVENTYTQYYNSRSEEDKKYIQWRWENAGKSIASKRKKQGASPK